MNGRNCKLQNMGWLLIQVIVGVVFLFHGSQKLFGLFGGHGIAGMAKYLESLSVPMPLLNAWLASLAEFVGGLFILLGIKVRWAAFPLVPTMLTASFMVHNAAWDIQKKGMEYTMTLAVVALALVISGGTNWKSLFTSKE